MSAKLRKVLSLAITISLLFQQAGSAQIAAEELNIANHLARMASSFVVEKFRPLHLRYFSYDALNDNFKVLVDKGDFDKLTNSTNSTNATNATNLTNATKDLISYFLVGVTLPDDMFWVNLRPDSENQIIDPWLEQTDVGKIMLQADLQLKKDTSAMTSPATPEGREYWDRLYKKAAELYGYDNVSIPTLTRPWIVPGEIIVRETAGSRSWMMDGGKSTPSAYIYKATLKVMLEEDYLKSSQPQSIIHNPLSTIYAFKDSRAKVLNEYSTQLIRELIIPKLTKEVNSSKRYAPLRQVYYSLILSRWFKLRFSGKTGTYASLINTRNLADLISKESWSKTDYFKQYQKSFTDGEYNIKEPVYTPTGQVIRSYFSGGIQIGSSPMLNDKFMGKDNLPRLPGILMGGKAVNPPNIALQSQTKSTSSPLNAKELARQLNLLGLTYELVDSFITGRFAGEDAGLKLSTLSTNLKIDGVALDLAISGNTKRNKILPSPYHLLALSRNKEPVGHAFVDSGKEVAAQDVGLYRKVTLSAEEIASEIVRILKSTPPSTPQAPGTKTGATSPVSLQPVADALKEGLSAELLDSLLKALPKGKANHTFTVGKITFEHLAVSKEGLYYEISLYDSFDDRVLEIRRYRDNVKILTHEDNPIEFTELNSNNDAAEEIIEGLKDITVSSASSAIVVPVMDRDGLGKMVINKSDRMQIKEALKHYGLTSSESLVDAIAKRRPESLKEKLNFIKFISSREFDWSYTDSAGKAQWPVVITREKVLQDLIEIKGSLSDIRKFFQEHNDSSIFTRGVLFRMLAANKYSLSLLINEIKKIKSEPDNQAREKLAKNLIQETTSASSAVSDEIAAKKLKADRSFLYAFNEIKSFYSFDKKEMRIVLFLAQNNLSKIRDGLEEAYGYMLPQKIGALLLKLETDISLMNESRDVAYLNSALKKLGDLIEIVNNLLKVGDSSQVSSGSLVDESAGASLAVINEDMVRKLKENTKLSEALKSIDQQYGRWFFSQKNGVDLKLITGEVNTSLEESIAIIDSELEKIFGYDIPRTVTYYRDGIRQAMKAFHYTTTYSSSDLFWGNEMMGIMHRYKIGLSNELDKIAQASSAVQGEKSIDMNKMTDSEFFSYAMKELASLQGDHPTNRLLEITDIRVALDALHTSVFRRILSSPEASRDIRLHVLLDAISKEEASRSKISADGKSQSSPVSDAKDVGGIDFRALPMTIQPMGSFVGLNFKLPKLSKAQLDKMIIDTEMREIQNMIQSGILPSGERIKELIAACVQKKEIDYRADSLLLCLIDICKLEEENAYESSAELREALVIVDAIS